MEMATSIDYDYETLSLSLITKYPGRTQHLAMLLLHDDICYYITAQSLYMREPAHAMVNGIVENRI